MRLLYICGESLHRCLPGHQPSFLYCLMHSAVYGALIVLVPLGITLFLKRQAFEKKKLKHAGIILVVIWLILSILIAYGEYALPPDL